MRRRRGLAPGLLWAASAVAVVVLFLLVGVVGSAIAPSPSGPALSSYATTPRGLAAWAELLQREGHVVERIRKPLTAVRLPATATLVVLGGADALDAADGRAVQRFVPRGGWLVVEGADAGVRRELRGRVITIADPSFLENAQLDRGSNAYRALAVAGPARRPVLFDEVVHGYGPAIGLAALPQRWWFAIALLALALGAWALSRALRLGGSDPVSVVQPRPRTAYVEAMAETLVRSASRSELVRQVEEAAPAEALFRGSL